MYERTDPVRIPGLPPMERHTCYDDDGNPLPDVRYSYARKGSRSNCWKKIVYSLLLLLLVALLIAATF